MKNIRILIVEDELIVGREIEQSLISFGCEVGGNVPSGEEALSALQTSVFELVIMDIHIEGDKNGIEIATIIKDTYNVPVIFISALSDKITLEKAKMIEPYGYIVKPFEKENLRATIEMALYKFSKDKESRIQQLNLSQLFSFLEEAIIKIKGDYSLDTMNETAVQLTGKYLQKSKGPIHIDKVVEFFNPQKEKISFAHFLNKHAEISEENILCYFPLKQEEHRLAIKAQRILLENNFAGWILIFLPNEHTQEKPLKQSTPATIQDHYGPELTCIFAKSGKKHVRISLEDILWFEATDNYVIIQTVKEQFIATLKLRELEAKLPHKDFLKIHRSYIIRLDKINYCEESYVNIYEKELPIGRSFKNIFRQKMLFA